MHIARIEIHQVSPTDRQVRRLIQQLNAYQIGLYGIAQCTLETPEEMMSNGAYMLGAFDGREIVGMGAVKLMTDYGEIKRMYVLELQRGHGYATKILSKLEEYVHSNGISIIKLETGNLHFGAMTMYEKNGYKQIKRFGDYKANRISVFYEKNWNN